MLRASTASILAALAALGALTACGHPAAHNPSNRAGAIATPDPAPEAGPEPTDVIDHLADGSDAPSICFGWAPETGAIICQVSQSSIQGGADLRLRFLGGGTTDVSYYHHPDDEQFFELDPARIDQKALAMARGLVVTGGFKGWDGAGVDLDVDQTITVGTHTLRRTRTETGTDGDGVTGSWPVSLERIELRCGDRWVEVPLTGDVLANTLEPPDLSVVAFGDQLLFTGSVRWAIEGDNGGGRDAALVDVGGRCR